MTEETDDKIVRLFGDDQADNWVDITRVDTSDEAQLCEPDEVLSAQIGKLRNVVLIGETESGGMMLASSLSRLADINFMVDAIKAKMVFVELE